MIQNKMRPISRRRNGEAGFAADNMVKSYREALCMYYYLAVRLGERSAHSRVETFFFRATTLR